MNKIFTDVVSNLIYFSSAPIRPRIRRSRSYIIWYERQPFRGKVGDNLTTLKGRKLTLTCPAFGLPQPAISWYRGGMRMRSGGNYVAIGNTLIMFNLDPMDTDRYTCVARNFAGVTSATSTLKVHGKNKYTLPFVTLCSHFLFRPYGPVQQKSLFLCQTLAAKLDC